MDFRDSAKERIWFGLLSYEYERHVRDLYEQGMAEGWLDFSVLNGANEDEKRRHLKEQATPFVCLSVRQSKELFAAAEQASDATKPMLSYYGMMNLVKGLLAVDAPDFFEDKKNLHHGLSVREGDRHNLKFQDEAVTLQPTGVYTLGRKSLGNGDVCAMNERVFVKVFDLLKGLSDLYWDSQKVTQATPEQMNTFFLGLPDSKFDAYSQQFYVDTFVDKNTFEAVKPRLPLDLSQYFVFEESGPSFHLKSKLKTGIIQDLVNLLNEFSTLLMNTNHRFVPLKFDCTIEGPAGTSRTEAFSFTELEYLYLLTFYMGHTARYRPQVWDALISGRETEYVTLLKKFLHYADGKFIALVAARANAV